MCRVCCCGPPILAMQLNGTESNQIIDLIMNRLRDDPHKTVDNAIISDDGVAYKFFFVV